MTRRIPTVRNGALHEHIEEASSITVIAVESVAWYAWLEGHRTFRFECSASPFTARKEQRPGGWYWYAYRRQAGRLHTAYLGRSAELSATRLDVVAASLTGGIDRRGGECLHALRCQPFTLLSSRRRELNSARTITCRNHSPPWWDASRRRQQPEHSYSVPKCAC
jgi:hypothetical protein